MHNKCHILRWYEWGLLVFCKQTSFCEQVSFAMATIGTLTIHTFFSPFPKRHNLALPNRKALQMTILILKNMVESSLKV